MSEIIEIDKPAITSKQLLDRDYIGSKDDQHFFELINGKYLKFTEYQYFEVLFRQLIMHPELNTDLLYTGEVCQPDLFFKKMTPKERIENIRQYLLSLSKEKRAGYGLKRLTLEKKEKIKRMGLNLKEMMKAPESILLRSQEIVGNDFDFLEVKKEVEKIKKQLIKNAQKNLDEKSPRGGSFIKVSSNGDLSIDVKKFHFIRLYIVLYNELVDPFLRKHAGTGNQQSGIKSLIAHKMNYEFESRLGFRLGSKFVAGRLLDAKTMNHIPDLVKKLGVVEAGFFEHLKNVR